MKNRSLFVRGSGVRSFPSPSPQIPLIQNQSHGQAVSRLEPGVKVICGLLLALSTLGVSSCHSAAYYYYKFPEYTYAGRPIPPSKLAERVMIGVTANGSTAACRSSTPCATSAATSKTPSPAFRSADILPGYPGTILSFPAETRGSYIPTATEA